MKKIKYETFFQRWDDLSQKDKDWFLFELLRWQHEMVDWLRSPEETALEERIIILENYADRLDRWRDELDERVAELEQAMTEEYGKQTYDPKRDEPKSGLTCPDCGQAMIANINHWPKPCGKLTHPSDEFRGKSKEAHDGPLEDVSTSDDSTESSQQEECKCPLCSCFADKPPKTSSTWGDKQEISSENEKSDATDIDVATKEQWQPNMTWEDQKNDWERNFDLLKGDINVSIGKSSPRLKGWFWMVEVDGFPTKEQAEAARDAIKRLLKEQS